GLGGEFFDAVVDTMAVIEAHPEIGRTVGRVSPQRMREQHLALVQHDEDARLGFRVRTRSVTRPEPGVYEGEVRRDGGAWLQCNVVFASGAPRRDDVRRKASCPW